MGLPLDVKPFRVASRGRGHPGRSAPLGHRDWQRARRGYDRAGQHDDERVSGPPQRPEPASPALPVITHRLAFRQISPHRIRVATGQNPAKRYETSASPPARARSSGASDPINSRNRRAWTHLALYANRCALNEPTRVTQRHTAPAATLRRQIPAPPLPTSKSRLWSTVQDPITHVWLTEAACRRIWL